MNDQSKPVTIDDTPEIIVHEPESFRDELEDIIAGIYQQGRNSINYSIVADFDRDEIIEVGADLIEQCVQKWKNKTAHQYGLGE